MNENQTIARSEPKFTIVSARISGVTMSNDEITKGLTSGEVQLQPGDVMFLDSGLNPEDTLLSVQTYAGDKYQKFCSDNAEVSTKAIKLCDTSDQNVCVAIRKQRAELMSL